MEALELLSDFFVKGEEVFFADRDLNVDPVLVQIDSGSYIEFLTFDHSEEQGDITCLPVYFDLSVPLFYMLYYVAKLHEKEINDVHFHIVTKDYWKDFDDMTSAEEFFHTYTKDLKEEVMKHYDDIINLIVE